MNCSLSLYLCAYETIITLIPIIIVVVVAVFFLLARSWNVDLMLGADFSDLKE